MSTSENATEKDKTYTRSRLIILFDGFESLALSLVHECRYRNDFVMSDIDVNLAVLNDLDRKNILVDINIEFHGSVITRTCKSLPKF